MHGRTVVVLAAVIMALALVQAAGAQTPVGVGVDDVQLNPAKYYGKVVIINGTVAEAVEDAPGTMRGVFVIKDGSNPDGIRVKTGSLPSLGVCISVTGEVSGDPNGPVLNQISRKPGRFNESGECVPTGMNPIIWILVAAGGVLVILAIVLIIVIAGKPKAKEEPAPAPAPEVPAAPQRVCLNCGVVLQPGWQSCPTCGAPAGQKPAPRISEPGTVKVTAAAPETQVISMVRTNAWLVVEAGPNRGKKYDLNKPALRIGRSGSMNDIIIEDNTVSREQCVLRNREGKFLLADRGSANGTFLNGEKIAGDVELNDGDTISIGETKLVFKRV